MPHGLSVLFSFSLFVQRVGLQFVYGRHAEGRTVGFSPRNSTRSARLRVGSYIGDLATRLCSSGPFCLFYGEKGRAEFLLAAGPAARTARPEPPRRPLR